MKKFIEWLHDLISIEEAKSSSLVLCLLLTLSFSFTIYHFRGDIPDSLENILLTLIYVVGGTSSLSHGISLYGSKTKKHPKEEKKVEKEYNDDQSI